MKAIGYLRVSTAGQAGEDRFGLESQRALIEEYAAEHGYEIAEEDWFVDGGVSGVIENRPALDKILFGEVRNPPVEAVIVAKSDRVARDIKLYYYYLMLLEKKGMRLISATEPVVNDDTGLGTIYYALMLFVAEQERRNIKMRTALGKERKSLEGGYVGGRPPYGYAAVGNELNIVPHEANVVREMFVLRDRGFSLNQIVTEFVNKGIRTRKGTIFSTGGISHILQRELFYMGYVQVGDKMILGKHAPILSPVRYINRETKELEN